MTFFVIDMEVLFIFIWNGFDLELNNFFFIKKKIIFSKYPAYTTHESNMCLLNNMFDYDGKQSLSHELIIIIIIYYLLSMSHSAEYC